MLSIQIDNEHKVSVAYKGRGNWSIDHAGWVTVLSGFGGENSLTIQLTGWQSGHTVIAMSMGFVDGDTFTHTTRIKTFDPVVLTRAINNQICIWAARSRAVNNAF